MNYLAHAYLSFGFSDILVGNMISDYVKGKEKYTYTPEVQSGIMLHRMIDEFTDQHDSVIQAKQLFRPTYRLYAGAFIDVIFDHFLAIDPLEFKSPIALQLFSAGVYNTLDKYIHVMPGKFLKIFPHMKQHDWLYNYISQEGLKQSLGGLQYRAKYIAEIDTAFELFITHYATLQKSYSAFFPELKSFVRNQLF